MNKFKILIVEDDPGSMLTLESAVYKLGYSEILTTDNSESALEIIHKESPDLLLLDIEIKGVYNGIEVAQKVKHLNIPVIFITGLDDSLVHQEAKATYPYAYLLKPFNILTLETAIDNVINIVEPDLEAPVPDLAKNSILKDSLFIKNGSMFQKVKYSEIQWIQSEGNYCTLFTNPKKYAIRISLSRFIERLPADIFLRIHKRYAVQAALINRIDTFSGEIFIEDQVIPMGRTYKDAILEKLNKV